MKLRFIGNDGALRVKNGKVYDVTVHSVGEFICVTIEDPDLGTLHYPYRTPSTFAHNWKRP